MKKPIEIWRSFSPTVKVALIAGVLSLLGPFIGTFLKPLLEGVLWLIIGR